MKDQVTARELHVGLPKTAVESIHTEMAVSLARCKVPLQKGALALMLKESTLYRPNAMTAGIGTPTP